MRVIGSLGVTGSRREIESERGEPVEYDGSRKQGREEFWRDGDKTSSWPSPRGVTDLVKRLFVTNKRKCESGAFIFVLPYAPEK